MKKLTFLYTILFLTCTIPHIVSAQTTSVAEDAAKPNATNSAVDSYIKKSEPEESASQNLQSQKILALSSLSDEQRQQIIYLQEKVNKLENSSGLNFAVWTGILLTSVAVILTVLGIVMALFSFLGYKKMIKSAQDAAERISVSKATEVSERLAPGVTESVLLKLMDQGNFDALIFESVQKVTYRGIAFASGDMLEENEEEGGK